MEDTADGLLKKVASDLQSIVLEANDLRETNQKLSENAKVLRSIGEHLEKLPALEETRKVEMQRALTEILTPLQVGVTELSQLTTNKMGEHAVKIQNLESAVGLVSTFLTEQARAQANKLSETEKRLSRMERLLWTATTGAAGSAGTILWKLFGG